MRLCIWSTGEEPSRRLSIVVSAHSATDSTRPRWWPNGQFLTLDRLRSYLVIAPNQHQASQSLQFTHISYLSRIFIIRLSSKFEVVRQLPNWVSLRGLSQYIWRCRASTWLRRDRESHSYSWTIKFSVSVLPLSPIQPGSAEELKSQTDQLESNVLDGRPIGDTEYQCRNSLIWWIPNALEEFDKRNRYAESFRGYALDCFVHFLSLQYFSTAVFFHQEIFMYPVFRPTCCIFTWLIAGAGVTARQFWPPSLSRDVDDIKNGKKTHSFRQFNWSEQFYSWAISPSHPGSYCLCCPYVWCGKCYFCSPWVGDLQTVIIVGKFQNSDKWYKDCDCRCSSTAASFGPGQIRLGFCRNNLRSPWLARLGLPSHNGAYTCSVSRY
jgi:hypothetical protein